LTYLQQCSTFDRKSKIYFFSRSIAIISNTNTHIHARKEQILAMSVIVLEE